MDWLGELQTSLVSRLSGHTIPDQTDNSCTAAASNKQESQQDPVKYVLVPPKKFQKALSAPYQLKCCVALTSCIQWQNKETTNIQP